ncbi:hypothetical protein J4E85_000725 [Alternaria conjuncta]|uniref:uncharacterized protein n=1 Tax=Alternaria conjuncta TaxID=181017 RepID=UPI0022203133|nr:uncharacterized protein J4E85_000725 [Alternaria conjuncta]KAI4938286.1 hypothetical protein J4E85_000725 [Alternaria conjuncta]
MSSSDSTGLAPSSPATAKQPSFFAGQMAALQSVQPWTPSQIAATSTSASSAAQGFNATSSSDVRFTNPVRSKAQSPAPATKEPMQQEHVTAPEEDLLNASSSESLDSNQFQPEVGGIIESSTIGVTRPSCVADTDPMQNHSRDSAEQIRQVFGLLKDLGNDPAARRILAEFLQHQKTTQNPRTQAETPARKTIFIVQVRASSGATANAARRLLKRPAEIWQAYLRAYPLPEGTEAVRYRQKDTYKLKLYQYSYIFSHQWTHKASAGLLISDSDNTLAREILDLTNGQPLHIVVIGTGIDGLSVNNTSWKHMHKRWPKATFELCLMVPKNSQYLTKFPQIASMYDDYFTTIRVQTSELASAFETAHIDEVRVADASTPRNKMIVLLFLLIVDLEMAALAKTVGLRKVSRNLGFPLNGGSSRSDDAGEPQKKKRKTNVTPSVSVSIDDSDTDYNDDSGDDSDYNEPPIKPTRVMRSDQQRGSHKTT